MQRYSDAFNIRKSDIGKTVIKKIYKDLFEWWIYRKVESRFIDTAGKKLKTGEEYLYCIIACGNDYGIKQQNTDFVAVEGCKFTEEDLKEYLSKTHRTDGLFKLPQKEGPDDNNPVSVHQV